MDRQELPEQEPAGGGQDAVWVDSGTGPGTTVDVGWLRPNNRQGVLAVGTIERAVILRYGRGPDLLIPPQAWERFLAEVKQGLYDNLFN